MSAHFLRMVWCFFQNEICFMWWSDMNRFKPFLEKIVFSFQKQM